MPLQQMTEQNSYENNDNVKARHELAKEIREIYDLPMISKEENKDLMTLNTIINLMDF
jgi:hypothetical protein